MPKRRSAAHASSAIPALWICPKCARRFVAKNRRHTCAIHTLDEHFEGRDPKLRRAFDAFVAAMRRVGPIVVESQKSRIVFVARIRFAACVVRKQSIQAEILLARRSKDQRFSRIEPYGARAFAHHFELADASDVDEELRALLPEAYAAGAAPRAK